MDLNKLTGSWIKAKKDFIFENWNLETKEKSKVKIEKGKYYAVYAVISSEYDLPKAVLINYKDNDVIPVVLSEEFFILNIPR